MRVRATVLALLALSVAYAAEPKVKAERWETMRTVKQIPPGVLEILHRQFSSDNRLADVGEEFDATDIVKGLPQRRLVLAGHTSAEWFVAYEHGGRGHHLDFVLFNMRGLAPVLIAAFDIDAGAHDDANGWRLTLADVQPILDSPRPTVWSNLRAH